MFKSFFKVVLLITLGFGLVGCGGSAGVFGKIRPSEKTRKARAKINPNDGALMIASGEATPKKRETIWDLFTSPDQNTNVRVNKYLWNASLETLNFLPVESADPFTGVLVLGWGHAPGSSRSYRATVLVQDPALDARSLKLSIQTRGGPASAETTHRIEDAILTRARQLRIRDKNL